MNPALLSVLAAVGGAGAVYVMARVRAMSSDARSSGRSSSSPATRPSAIPGSLLDPVSGVAYAIMQGASGAGGLVDSGFGVADVVADVPEPPPSISVASTFDNAVPSIVDDTGPVVSDLITGAPLSSSQVVPASLAYSPYIPAGKAALVEFYQGSSEPVEQPVPASLAYSPYTPAGKAALVEYYQGEPAPTPPPAPAPTPTRFRSGAEAKAWYQR